MRQDRQVGRREFAQQLAFGAGITIGATASAVGQDPHSVTPPAPKLPIDTPGDTKAPPPEALLLSYLLRTYPSEHFDETAVAGIFRDLRGDLARGQLLSEFPLKNGDEPAFVFSPYRNDSRVPSDQ